MLSIREKRKIKNLDLEWETPWKNDESGALLLEARGKVKLQWPSPRSRRRPVIYSEMLETSMLVDSRTRLRECIR